MLILQRRAGESLYIGDDIYVEVLAVDSGRVRLAIRAPEHVPILRSELRIAIDTNRDSAQEQAPPAALLDLLTDVWKDGRGTPQPPVDGDHIRD